MMRILGAVMVATGIAAGVLTAQDAPALPPLEQCQADGLRLRSALVEAQQRAILAEAALAQRELTTQRAELEPHLREVLKCTTDGFDWNALRCLAVGRP